MKSNSIRLILHEKKRFPGQGQVLLPHTCFALSHHLKIARSPSNFWYCRIFSSSGHLNLLPLQEVVAISILNSAIFSTRDILWRPAPLSCGARLLESARVSQLP